MGTTKRGRVTRKTPGVRQRETLWLLPSASDSVRWSKVRAARTRIATGYYDLDEVQEAVIDEVFKELHRH